MQNRSYEKLRALGFDTDLIEKCVKLSLTLTSLKNMPLRALLGIGFAADEARTILRKVNRAPIPELTIETIIEKCGGVCCFCADGNSERPYQIHHIEEYHLTQNHAEENLLLVCPTHHVVIHQKGMSTDEQKQKQRQWASIFDVVKYYAVKGITFPFGAFESIDYNFPGYITEVFEFGLLSASTCVKVLGENNRKHASQQLASQNGLLITGISGSGKSTFAKGLAGTFSGISVYGYIVPKQAQQAVNEIMTFCANAVRPFILIIDNANTTLSDGQIERILSAATADKKLIVINTRGGAAADNEVEQRYPDAVFPLNWPILKDGIKDMLLKNEHEIVTYLKENKLDNSFDIMIGEGRMNRDLENVIDGYVKSVKSAWEFFYMFTNGIERVDALQVDLYAYDRLDIILLFIAIQQVAKVDHGSTIKEIAELYETHPLFQDGGLPEIEWVNDQLNALSKRRVIRNERGRFNTVHREFAVAYIEHLHFKAKAATEHILINIFDNALRIDETVYVWSWLRETAARTFIHAWAITVSKDRWKTLIREAINKGVRVVSMLSSLMRDLNFQGRIDFTGVFEDSAPGIAELISKIEENSIYVNQNLFSSLERLQPGIVKEILVLTDRTAITAAIKAADPAHFDSFSWLFNTIAETYPEWIFEAQNDFSQDDFIQVIERVEKGDIDSLRDVIDFQRRYIRDIYRSDFKMYTQKFGDLLKNCGVRDINYSASGSSGFADLALFKQDVLYILSSLDVPRLSGELSTSQPRDWDNLGMLAMLTDHVQSDVFKRIINGINVEALRRHIERYHKEYHWELRVLMFFLAYGSSSKRKEMAEMLHPYVRIILEENGHQDRNDILVAFFHLDQHIGNQLIGELNMLTPKSHIRVDPKSWQAAREECEKYDNLGEDYLLWSHLIRKT